MYSRKRELERVEYVSDGDIAKLKREIDELEQREHTFEQSKHNVEQKVEGLTKKVSEIDGKKEKNEQLLESEEKLYSVHVELLHSYSQHLATWIKKCNKASEQLAKLEQEYNALVDAKKEQQQLFCGQLSSLSNPKRMHLEEPPSLSVLCSSATAEEICKREATGYVFHHKFAIALYNLRQHLDKGNHSDFEFMSHNYKPNLTSLDELISTWSTVTGHENTHTSILSCALHDFLFKYPGDSVAEGYCLHQVALPNINPPCFPDFCIVPTANSSPVNCVAIADYKKSDRDHSSAVTESCAYSLKSRQKTDFYRNLRIVFPCTQKTAELIIHFPIDQRVVSICVFPEKKTDHDVREADRTFFCMLYAGVHYLLQNPIVADGMLHPSDNLKFTPSLEKNPPVVRWIFRKDDKVYKFFGHNTYCNVNLDLVKEVLTEAEEVFLTEDDCYSYLVYNFRCGTHYPNEWHGLKQFAMLVQQLQRIHDKGYVHSDIRMANLVFSETHDDAWIIDYDLADVEGSLYPLYYNHLHIRHPDALAGNSRKKEHDVYSLNKIATSTCFVTENFYDKYMNGMSLTDIAKELLEVKLT